MNDEERRLFRREMNEARNALEDAYVRLRASGLPVNNYLAQNISKWLFDNFDIDAELMYQTIKDQRP